MCECIVESEQRLFFFLLRLLGLLGLALDLLAELLEPLAGRAGGLIQLITGARSRLVQLLARFFGRPLLTGGSIRFFACSKPCNEDAYGKQTCKKIS